jgi:hypothetical protein
MLVARIVPLGHGLTGTVLTKEEFSMRIPGIVVVAAAVACSSSAPPLAAAETHADVEGVIGQYCTKCHNFEDYAGGIDLEGISPDNIDAAPEIGEKVIRRLRAGMMPPVGEPRPDVATMQALATALENRIDSKAAISPGRPGIRRLNRAEFQNAIRDLLGLDVDAADYLPADDSSRGFDNQAGTLVVSPALLEAYVSTAGKLTRLALGTTAETSQTLYRVAEDANQNYRLDGAPLATRGGITFTHQFPVDGEYAVKIFPVTERGNFNARPFGGVDGEQLEVLVDNQLVKTFDWDQEFAVRRSGSGSDAGQVQPTLDLRLPLQAGPHTVTITFVASNFAPGLDMNNDFERGKIETGRISGYTFYPHVDSVRIDGPFGPGTAEHTPSRDRIFTCYPTAATDEETCARRILTGMAALAYRGYDTAEDIDELMAFFRQGRAGAGFETGVEIALQRMLASPKFIYRIEEEPEGVKVGEPYRISDLDLASRLSFFLWSSIPDQELLSLAKENRLHEPEVLDAQVRRLLSDARSEAMTQNFAGQWLTLRNLDAQEPVLDEFPDFDDLLRQSFRKETELLFDSLIREDRPLTDLLTADYTFVNERLALHYGIPGIKGARFRRVQLQGDQLVRAGILGKGAVLTVASQPGRTSPVMRGKWVLSNLIGVEPPPPPPNVPALETKPSDAAGNTVQPSMREQMEAHRANPACQGCHRLMDPIGFALESFDAVGKFRREENGRPIDTAGTLYSGFELTRTGQLKDFLLQYKESIARNATEKMLTYALGRGMDYQDMPLVRKVQHEAAKDDYRLQSLISAVVRSDAFLENEKVGGETLVAAFAGQAQTRSAGGQ